MGTVANLVPILFLLAGCSVASVETPEARDPASVPTGPIEATGDDATGPVVELGSGRLIGHGWRYSIYPSADGWCTQLETAATTSAGCGDLLPVDGEAFGGIGVSAQLSDGISTIDGVAAEEVATVWVILDGGLRVPAVLIPLDDVGLDGQAFVALIPDGERATHVQALAVSEEVLDTYELP